MLLANGIACAVVVAGANGELVRHHELEGNLVGVASEEGVVGG